MIDRVGLSSKHLTSYFFCSTRCFARRVVCRARSLLRGGASFAASSAPDESRRWRGGVLDASATTARRVVFLLWGGASADPASLHDDNEGASWPSLVLQTSRIDGVEGFRRVSRDRRRRLLSETRQALPSKKRAQSRQRAAVLRVLASANCSPLIISQLLQPSARRRDRPAKK